MFIQWVEKRIIPTFNKLHPGKKIILILDNAPYHYTRTVPILTSKSKKDIIALMFSLTAEQPQTTSLLLPLASGKFLYPNSQRQTTAANANISTAGDARRSTFSQTEEGR